MIIKDQNKKKFLETLKNLQRENADEGKNSSFTSVKTKSVNEGGEYYDFQSELPSLGHKKPKRLGRGKGSGLGKTSGRGMKGQRARSKVNRLLEGGQTVLFRRLPKFGQISRKSDSILEVTLFHLKNIIEKNNITSLSTEDILNYMNAPKRYNQVKIIHKDVQIDFSKLALHINKISKGAKEAIEHGGGSINLIAVSAENERKTPSLNRKLLSKEKNQERISLKKSHKVSSIKK